MKRLMSLFAVASLAVGGLVLAGCDSSSENLPPNERGAYAGGNGAFGESPVNPGVYSSDSGSQSTTQPSQNTAHSDLGY